MSFADKVVIVTGASAGIGAAIAFKFCQEGAGVSLVGRNQEKLKAVLEKCQNTVGKPHVVTADVTNENDAKRIIEETLKQFGKLDVLVNNAGIVSTESIFDENIMEKYDKVMNTNLRSAVHLTSVSAKHLVETKGNIVNISSAMSTMVSGNFTYNVSKAALDHFTRCVALELSSKGVRVNTVNPGPVVTDILENLGVSVADKGAVYENLKFITALKRVGEPEEIANLVLFLASDKASSVTGSSYFSDNGMSLVSLTLQGNKVLNVD